MCAIWLWLHRTHGRLAVFAAALQCTDEYVNLVLDVNKFYFSPISFLNQLIVVLLLCVNSPRTLGIEKSDRLKLTIPISSVHQLALKFKSLNSSKLETT